ncbi:MAG: hypothetical protein CMP11_01965 [Zetaproteobacteria bacterium]|nr:hypothetical protein [Pseudobdellovibrionaceae bacterium]|tara:strand:- start:454 stop:1491 length:1038 start_codon:yes stop_codon:yes gene_type:complete
MNDTQKPEDKTAGGQEYKVGENGFGETETVDENNENQDVSDDIENDLDEILEKKPDKKFNLDSNKKKFLVVLVLFATVTGAILFLFDEDDEWEENDFIYEKQDFTEDNTTRPLPALDNEKLDSDLNKEKLLEKEDMESLVEQKDIPNEDLESDSDLNQDLEPQANVSLPKLLAPEDGQVRFHDESAHPAKFTWSGGSGTIFFSQSSSMSPVLLKDQTQGGDYTFHRLSPGKWFWRVENDAGKSEVRSFTVKKSPVRNISLLSPEDGGVLNLEKDLISWQGGVKITFYRIEISKSGWQNPDFTFATTGTSLKVSNIPGGDYSMRLGAFSEVSGKWEYSKERKVVIQ